MNFNLCDLGLCGLFFSLHINCKYSTSKLFWEHTDHFYAFYLLSEY